MSEELGMAGLPLSFTSSKIKIIKKQNINEKEDSISTLKNRKKKAQKKRKKFKLKLTEISDPTGAEDTELNQYNYAEEFKINEVLQDYKDPFTILMPKSERFKCESESDETEFEAINVPLDYEFDDGRNIPQVSSNSLTLTNNQKKKLNSKNSLQKYYHQRYDYFKLFDFGIQIDEEGWYSVTPEAIADHIAQEALAIAKTSLNGNSDPHKKLVVLDAFCGVGGNTIQFAKYFDQVLAVDLDPTRLSMARNNAQIYGVADRITFIQGDVFEILQDMRDKAIDLVFMSPPWGGPDYVSKSVYCAREDIFDGRGLELFQLGRSISKNLILFLPRQCDIFSIAKMVKLSDGHKDSIIKDDESFVVEQHWLRNRLKAISIYFYS